MTPLTPQALRDVADTLDLLDLMTRTLYGPLKGMEDMNATSVEVTIELSHTSGIARMAETVLRFVDDDAMQADLRRWADEMDAP